MMVETASTTAPSSPNNTPKSQKDQIPAKEPNQIPLAVYEQKYLLIPKLIYFAFCVAYYSCFTFRLKFYKDVLDINESEAGFIYAATFIVMFLGSIVWNYAADHTARLKLVTMLSMILMGGVFQLFRLSGSIPIEQRGAFNVFVILLWCFAYSGLLPLIDAVILQFLKGRGLPKELYGRQRMFGALGYCMVTLLSGRLLDVSATKTTRMTPSDIKASYDPIYYIVLTCCLGFVVVFALFIPNDDPKVEFQRRQVELVNNLSVNPDVLNQDDSRQPRIMTKLDQLKALLRSPQFVFLLVITLFAGYGRQTMYMLRSLYLEEKILGDDPNRKLYVSLSSTVGVPLELTLYWLGKPLLQRLGKHWLLVLSLFLVSVRMWVYVAVPEGEKSWIYFLLAVDTLVSGSSFGALQIAAVQISDDASGPDLSATAQGLFNSVNNGISGIVGCLGSGLILRYTNNNFKITLMSGAIVTSVALVIAIVYIAFYKTVRK